MSRDKSIHLRKLQSNMCQQKCTSLLITSFKIPFMIRKTPVSDCDCVQSLSVGAVLEQVLGYKSPYSPPAGFDYPSPPPHPILLVPRPSCRDKPSQHTLPPSPSQRPSLPSARPRQELYTSWPMSLSVQGI